MSTIKAVTLACASLISLTVFAQDKEPIEGHYLGNLLSQTGEFSEAEISLDNYKCFALSVKKDQGLETGFYSVDGNKLNLKTPKGEVYRSFEIEQNGNLKAIFSKDVKVPENCCELTKN